MGRLYPDADIDRNFIDPPAEFRAAPFWAWNCRLEKDVLDEMIDVFKDMGFGGFHIHSRIGLDTPYLGEEFMALVMSSHEKGKQNGMRTFLYDEDKWPSGYGAGMVTKEKLFRARYLLFTPCTYPDGPFDRHMVSSSRITRNGDISYIGSFKVHLDEDGFLSSYSPSEREEGNWHLYLVVTGDTPWFNNQSYVDVLSKEAISRFTQIAHDAYYRKLGEEFGKSVPSIFSDEPQYFKEENLSSSFAEEGVGLPYSDSVGSVFSSLYGKDLLSIVPEIIWESSSVNKARYCYHEALSRCFSESFSGTIHSWCMDHGLMSTGHLMGEATLDSQARFVGDALRSYRYYYIPGIDMLADRHEYNTVKQAESGRRQWGGEGLMCELYGVTNWDFDFRGHKRQGDWLAALGVTLRVPHLSWVSMAGEAKRDYPSPIDQHAAWYKEYPAIENHFARLNLALTRGKAVTHVGVIHPIESYWCIIGPDDKTAMKRRAMDRHFDELTKWLLFGQIDFDFISEDQIEQLYDGEKGFGKCSYDIILIPDMLTMRKTTLSMLERFSKRGKAAFIGRYPEVIDAAIPFDRASVDLPLIPFEEDEVLSFIEEVRDVEIIGSDHLRREDLVYQLREDGAERYLFIAHGRERDRMEKSNQRSAKSDMVHIWIRGEWGCTLYDTMAGGIHPLASTFKKGWTELCYPLFEHDSILVKLTAAKGDAHTSVLPSSQILESVSIRRPSSYVLAEDNVLLLDKADYYLDGTLLGTDEELLRLDDRIRSCLGYQHRNEAYPQPWLYPDEERAEHSVQLVFRFRSEIECNIDLALEMRNPEITLNGNRIADKDSGFFVDKAIRRIELGRIRRGDNTLLLEFPFGRKTNIEWCYILGQFGVDVRGQSACIVGKPENIDWGDISRQSFAFYGGSISYSFEYEGAEGEWFVTVPSYKGALVRVTVDDESKGLIIGEPYRLHLGHLRGKHRISLLLYGNRYNCFGQLHNTDSFEAYWGPKTWRTTGQNWSYTYQLKSFGILTEPLMEVIRYE